MRDLIGTVQSPGLISIDRRNKDALWSTAVYQRVIDPKDGKRILAESNVTGIETGVRLRAEGTDTGMSFWEVRIPPGSNNFKSGVPFDVKSHTVLLFDFASPYLELSRLKAN